MREPHIHAIPSDLGVAEAPDARDALRAAIAAAREPEGEGGLLLDLTGPNPGQIALQLLIAARAETLRLGVDLTMEANADAALRPVRADREGAA
jgi:hypothetical protein